MSARGIPEQDKPENQDESVLFNVDQTTGKVRKVDPKTGEVVEDEDDESKDYGSKKDDEKADEKDEAAKAAAPAVKERRPSRRE